MKIENLRVGMVIKNYRELCKILEIEVQTSNSKIAQLNDLSKYCKFKKNGNKFIIEEIINTNYIKTENRGKSEGSRNNNSAFYIKNIKKLILDLLAQEKIGEVIISKNKLLQELNMINCNYSFAKYRQNKLSKLLQVDETIVREWFDLNNNTIIRNLESALKSLENESLIDWNQSTSVAEIIQIDNKIELIKTVKVDEWDEKIIDYKFSTNGESKYFHRIATYDERRFILRVEKEVMIEMGFENKQKIVLSGKWNEFISKVKDILEKEFHIAYYYKSYNIIYNHDHIIKEIENLKQLELTEEERLTERTIVNMGVMDTLNKNAHNRQQRASKEEDNQNSHRVNSTYISDCDKISLHMIDNKTKDIRDDIYKTKIK